MTSPRPPSWLRKRFLEPFALGLSETDEEGSGPPFSIADALKSPERVLVIPDGRPGGLFLGASQFWAIRERYPEAKITLLAREPKAYIAREIPFVDEVILYDDFLVPIGNQVRKTVFELKQRSFDIAFCFSSEESLCPYSLCHKSGARLRIGFQRDDYPFFNVRIVPGPEASYELDRLSLIIRTLGIPQVKERVSWSVSEKGAEQLRERFLVARKPDESFVALDVSSTSKALNFKQFLGISEQAVAVPNTRVLIFFDYPSRKLANRLKENLGPKALLFQTDDLPKIVALLEACDHLISCNTDLFHLAVSTEMPVTGIFASAEIVRWTPSNREDLEILELETLRGWGPRQIKEAVQRRLNTTPDPEEVSLQN